MCGIAGVVNLNHQKPSLPLLKKMTDSIAHRGPDDSGIEVSGQAGLGNRRLAIIDLSPKGHQPMWSKDKKYLITYNGEIYNYKNLQTLLYKKGYRFKSQSDTEVILYLFQEFGPKSVAMLRGMFAFAIWDSKNLQLFLARDHFGIKPLHYFINESVFIFGSEIKTILLHPGVKKAINSVALSHYFSLGFGCVASPETIYKSIYKLPPGYYAVLKNRQLTLKKYWDLSHIRINNAVSITETVTQTRQLIERSVTEQLVSDVPLGCFLSGGIDSSLITAYAQKHLSRPIKTFSIGFEDKDYDESEYALKVAKYLKTDHYHHQFKTKDLIDTLPKVVDRLDEPLADASILPTYLLSEFTRKQVTVALSGDGGDEIFAGYPTYLAHRLVQPLRIFSPSVLEILKQVSMSVGFLIKLLPVSYHMRNLPIRTKLNKVFSGISRNITAEHLNFMGPLLLKDKNKLLINHQESALPYTQIFIDQVKYWPTQSQLQYLDFMIFLAEDCLVKTDRASSFNSLEVRPPFLNKELVEYVFSLPSSFKVNGLTLKYLLKQVAQDLLPKEIIIRPKKGFGVPVDFWLKNDLKPLMTKLLAKKRLEKQALFKPEFIHEKINQHLINQTDNSMLLWSLIVFQLWWDKWFIS